MRPQRLRTNIHCRKYIKPENDVNIHLYEAKDKKRDAGSNNGSALSTWVFDKARTSGESAVVTDDPNSYVVVFHSVGRQEYKTVDVRHILFQVSTSDLALPESYFHTV